MPTTDTDGDRAAQLRAIERRLVEMGGRSERQIGEALAALCAHDGELAKAVIARDDEIDRDEIEIDQLVLDLLTRWPARDADLRFLVLSLKLVTDLERIGDLAANIATRVVELGRLPHFQIHSDVPRLADLVQQNLREALVSLVERDAVRAERVIAADVEIDRLNAGLFVELLSRVANDYGSVTRVVPLTSVVRYLERIGDHVTNLAEGVIFMVRGRDVRHPTARS